MPATIDYPQLVQLIKKLHAKKVTGTLFLHTADNKSCMLIFRIGVVIGVTFDTLRGREAIQALRRERTFSYRFQEGKPPPVRQDLESPEATLRALGVDIESTPEALEETMIMTSIPDLLKQTANGPRAKGSATNTPRKPKPQEHTTPPPEDTNEERGLRGVLKRLFRKAKKD